jgi:hypothetical protein
VGHGGLENSLIRHKKIINRAAAVLYLVIAGITLGEVTGIFT